ncbi:hypothetical protein HORIV_68490 [Vreelandella olivaria]|uniref:Uncharacterized protein n=1 Tax=Vreelandella olivaria TaxID=390919 RepID=A0ABM7GRY7_9GAMM|nr:hypothetical protein HORIV_68490 [Halomonas olivaria]
MLERSYTNLGQLDHLTLRGANSAVSEQQFKMIAYRYDAARPLIGRLHSDLANRYRVAAAGNRLAAPSPMATTAFWQASSIL